MIQKFLVFILLILNFLFIGCSSLNSAVTNEGSSILFSNQIDNNDLESTNARGWNESNCAHIMADGSCAHETAPNEYGLSDDQEDDVSDSSGVWNETNCAHVTADGSCAHEL